MSRLLLALLPLLPLLPLSASAQAFVLDRDGGEPASASVSACAGGLAGFEKQPTLALFRTLIPCLEDPDPAVRNRAFDKLCRREVWEDPGFAPLFPKLDALAAAGERDPATRGSAQTFRYWLENSKIYAEERRRAAAEQGRAAEAAAAAAAAPRRVKLSFIFGLGIVAQVLIFVLSSGADPSKLILAAGAGLLGLLPGRNERHYEPFFHVFLAFVVFAFVAFAAYKKEIMARVSESNLLVNSLTLWYLCVTFLGGPGRTLVLALAALPTVGTLLVAFLVREWSFKTKLACYVWFLALTAANTCFQVRFGNLLFLFDRSAEPRPLDLFLTGMAFAVLGASLFYVYILIPLRGKHESMEHRMKQWRQDAHAMAGSFSDYQLTAPQALQIVLLQGGFYLANHWLRFLMPGAMMNVSMVVLPLAFRFLGGAQPAPSGAAEPAS